MEIFTIEESTRPEEEEWSRWKPETPEMVLVLIDQGKCRLLDYCGRANEHESDHGELEFDVQGDEWELADGLWVVPGKPDYTKDYWGEVDGGWEQDGEPRRLTEEEWELYRDEDDVWDPKWLSPEPVDTTCGAPVPAQGECEGDVDKWMFFVDVVDCYCG